MPVEKYQAKADKDKVRLQKCIASTDLPSSLGSKSMAPRSDGAGGGKVKPEVRSKYNLSSKMKKR